MMTIEPTTATLSLRDRLVAARRTARHTGAPVLVSQSEPLAVPDPIRIFARAREVAATRLYWAAPQNRLVLVGVGVAHEFTAAGPDRFAQIAAAWQTLLATAVGSEQQAASSAESAGSGAIRNPGGPMLLGGFAFDPQGPQTPAWAGFPAGLLVLPRLLLACTADGAVLTTSVVVDAETDPHAEVTHLDDERAFLFAAEDADHAIRNPGRPLGPAIRVTDVRPAEEWKVAVAEAAANIQAGKLEKVVLAREVQIETERPLDPATALRRLQTGYPDCYLFAVARGTRCFLGATPERLVRLAGGEVQATCLAGSTRRGRDAEEDARLGADLLGSAKNREEHAVVVRMLSEALHSVCATMEIPDAPVLLRVRNVQHLYTPIRGRLCNGTTLLELVARLHPTPAVGGFPRAAALTHIRAHEDMDRGWYAAPVGWMDSRGNGEFAVALRSALLHGPTARAFAGCGIMGDSDPDAEYAETLVKLRAVLSALEEAQA